MNLSSWTKYDCRSWIVHEYSWIVHEYSSSHEFHFAGAAPSRLALLSQMTKFVEQRLNNNNTKFWDSLPNLKIKIFALLVKKKTEKLVDEKVLNINADS